MVLGVRVWLVMVVSTVTVLSVQEKVDDTQLDPFDMVNFDQANMKMRKKEAEESESNPTEDANETVPSKEKKEAEYSPSVREEGSAPVTPEDLQVQENTVGSCPALSLFQQFVSRLLVFVNGKIHKMETDTPTELCVRLQLTSSQLQILENFKKDNSKDQVFGVHDILNDALQGVHVLDRNDPTLHYLWLEEYFGLTVDKALQIIQLLASFAVLLVASSKIHFSRRLFVRILFGTFVVSVGMTWYRLVKQEEAKQHEAMMKNVPAGCNPVVDGGSIWDKLSNFFKYQFTFQQDACLQYYEHLIMDPVVKVSPMEAVAVAAVQTMLKPLRTVGTEISEFMRALVKDLPVQWQMITVTIVFSLVVLLLLLRCGYRVRIPFLFALEPSHSDMDNKVKELKETICHLEEDIASLKSSQSSRALPQACHTVGALSPATPQKYTPMPVTIRSVDSTPSASVAPPAQIGMVPIERMSGEKQAACECQCNLDKNVETASPITNIGGMGEPGHPCSANSKVTASSTNDCGDVQLTQLSSEQMEHESLSTSDSIVATASTD